MKRLLTQTLALALLCCGSVRFARADIIADSVADFSDVQGQNNWFYGYYAGPFSPVDFQQMTVFQSDTWYVDPGRFYTQLWGDGGHPSGTTDGGLTPVEQWAVRRYISEVSGQITLSGNIADENGGGGNGIIGHIFVGSNEIYSATIQNGDGTGVNYSLAVNVTVGTAIDFAIDPRASNDLFDSTRFTAVVSSTVPEPSPAVLGGLMALISLAGVWSNRALRRAR
jgi:hypothetical protein